MVSPLRLINPSLNDFGNVSVNDTKNNDFAPCDLITRHIGTSLGIYSFDHQGNVVRVNDAGFTDIRFSYNAWGQVNSIVPSYSWGSSFTNHTYNARWGYYRDGNGLYYCQHRYYEPQNGRWVTRDPIGYEGGVNVYGYCGNRPVDFVDPQGLWSFYRWLLTGDGDASDELDEAALNAANDGLDTAGHALRNCAKFGIGDDGSHYDEPGYTEAKHLTEVAMGCLIAAGIMKSGGINGSFQGPYKNTGGGGLQFTRNGETWFRFDIHPWLQKGSSNGHRRVPAPKWKLPHLHLTNNPGHWPWQ